MRTRIAICCLLSTTAVLYADTYKSLLQRYTDQIKQQERQMRSLRKELTTKEQEARAWQQKAEAAKSQWAVAGLAVQKARDMVNSYQEKRTQAHNSAEAAQWSAIEQSYVENAADAQLTYWVSEVYRERQTPHYFVDMAPSSVGPQLITDHLASLYEATHASAELARLQESSLRIEELRWQNEEQKQTLLLNRDRHRQQSLWLHWQEAQQRLTNLQEERVQLAQSAQALRIMLQELREHRDETVSSRVDTVRSHQQLKSLKGTLPWPVYGTVTQNFGRQYSEKLQQLIVSNGIKLEAEAGKSVRTIQAGKVLFARPFQQYGQLVIIQHKHGLTSVYGELGQTQVKEGDVVSALDPIGTVGDSRSFYFELRRDEEPINPLVWLAPQPLSELSTRRKFQ